MRNDRNSRPSFVVNAGADACSTPIKAIIFKIKLLANVPRDTGHELIPPSPESVTSSPVKMFLTEVVEEQVLVRRKPYRVRRVYLLAYPEYKVGWVVDSDLRKCMICAAHFGWTRFRHHCRSDSYATDIQYIHIHRTIIFGVF